MIASNRTGLRESPTKTSIVHRWSSAAMMPEQRRQRRMTCTIPVNLIDYSRRRAVATRLRNVSQSGLFIATTRRMAVGSPAEIEITIANSTSGGTLTLPGRVVRVDHDGLGFEFDRQRSQFENRIGEVLDYCQRHRTLQVVAIS